MDKIVILANKNIMLIDYFTCNMYNSYLCTTCILLYYYLYSRIFLTRLDK